MARNVIVLEKTNEDDETIEYRYAFWAAVPAARQSFYANAAFVSEVVGANGPTNPELTALRNGSVVEKTGSARFSKRNPDGTIRTGAQLLAAAKADLVTGFAQYQADINARNPWQRYATSYETSTGVWTDRTVS